MTMDAYWKIIYGLFLSLNDTCGFRELSLYGSGTFSLSHLNEDLNVTDNKDNLALGDHRWKKSLMPKN